MTGEGFPDALAGGPLADSAGAPILLARRDELPEVTADALASLDPDRVVVLGGPDALDEATAAAAGRAGSASVDRIQGADRYATAAAVAGRLPATDTVYLATGLDFPDALAGGPLAARDGAPILLARRDELPEVTADALASLDPDRVVVLGGPDALDEATAAAAGRAGSASVDRIQGADRYATAAAIAGRLPATDTVYVATGSSFPDALAIGPASGGAPVVLTEPQAMPAATRQALGARDGLQRLVILGGPQAIDPDLEAALTAAAND